MGFWTKLGNLIRGKGWTEQQEPSTEEIQPMPEIVKTPSPQTEQIEPETQTKLAPQEQPTVKTVATPAKKVDSAETELKSAIKKYNSRPSIQEVSRKINERGVNKVTQTQSQFGDIGHLKPQYTKLFSDNAKLNDPEILDVLIQNRQQLQHRFSAEINVYVDGKIGGTLNVFGILIEHTGLVGNFIHEGMKLKGDYSEYTEADSELQTILDNLGAAFKSHFGALEYQVIMGTFTEGTVTGVETNNTFA